MTVAGQPRDDLARGTWASILKQAGLKETSREDVQPGLRACRSHVSAFVPDLPGCVATGRTRAEVERRIHEAIEMHLAGLRSANQAIPEPSTWTGAVEIF